MLRRSIHNSFILNFAIYLDITEKRLFYYTGIHLQIKYSYLLICLLLTVKVIGSL